MFGFFEMFGVFESFGLKVLILKEANSYDVLDIMMGIGTQICYGFES